MKIASCRRLLFRNRGASASRAHSTNLPWHRSLAALIAPTSLLSVLAACVLAPTAAHAVSGTDVITTIAEPLFPRDVAVDSTGAVYFTGGQSLPNGKLIFGVEKVTPGGFAGASSPTYYVDVIATFLTPEGLTISKDGSLYVVDINQVWKVAPNGTVTTVAGNGDCGYSGDGGPAAKAKLCGPIDVAIATDGTLYIADFYNNRVRKVSPSGTITTAAGTGVAGFSGDGGSATAAKLNAPAAVAVAFKSLYIGDIGNHRVRKISPTGTITTVVGTGIAGSSGDGGAPAAAQIDSPTGLAFDRVGDLYIVDHQQNRIRKVTHMLSGPALPAGSPTITTAAGTGASPSSGDGGPAAAAGLYRPLGLAVGPDGSLVIADFWGNRIRRVRNDPPFAMFTMAEPSSPQVPYAVSFDASESTDPNDAIVLYQWSFGDSSRPASGQKVSHTYTSQGLFHATLTVTDASGATATTFASIYTGGSIPFPGAQPCIPMLFPC